jgi:hypothetical protein
MFQRKWQTGTLAHHTTVLTNITGKWRNFLFHTQEMPGSILGMEVAILKFVFGFHQSFHENDGITFQNRI